jgi:hypothetical protein
MLVSMSILSSASTRGDVKVIEATENLRYLSQKNCKGLSILYIASKKGVTG